MKPVSFDYQRPNNIYEALELLNEDHDARILAGGQSLIPMLSMRLSRPSMLIDIGHIEELAKMENTEGHIEIGAMVRQEAARTDYSIKSFLPLLAKGLKFVGHKPTRVRGTIGGSLAHADPSAEICLVAVTLGAEIVYHDFGEDLVFDASEFFIGPDVNTGPSKWVPYQNSFSKMSRCLRRVSRDSTSSE